jgi:hypothetical protein
LIQDVTTSFMAGLHVACVVAALVCLAGAIAALRLPGRQQAGTAVQPDTGTQRVPAASSGSPGGTDS